MIFCKIDEQLCTHIQEYAQGKLFIDCGAGEALFERMMPKNSVLSLDIRIQTDEVAVLQFDYREFEFIQDMIPIFIRPCHALQVYETIIKNLDAVDSFLYVSHPKNIKRDLPVKYNEFDVVHIFPEWEGIEGERIFEISVERTKQMSTFILVEYEYQGKHWGRREGQKLFNRAGGYCLVEEDDKILETVEAEDWEELDYTKTSLVDLNGKDAGWLDRNGKFYGCDSKDHDEVVYYYFKSTLEEFERIGWVRVYAAPETWREFDIYWHNLSRLRLSAEQRNWLSLRGHKVDEDD